MSIIQAQSYKYSVLGGGSGDRSNKIARGNMAQDKAHELGTPIALGSSPDSYLQSMGIYLSRIQVSFLEKMKLREIIIFKFSSSSNGLWFRLSHLSNITEPGFAPRQSCV